MRLWILSSPTCVGLRYGHPFGSLEVFLGSVDSVSWFVRRRTSPRPSVLMEPGFTWAPTYDHRRALPVARRLILLRHPIAQTPLGGAGILTRSPSATPFGLALGPTNPERIDLPQETLGFRRTRFSRVLSLLVPAGSLPCPPPVLVGRTSTNMECSSTNQRDRGPLESAASVSGLSPVELSAQIH